MAAIIVNNGEALNDKMSFKVTTTDYTQSVRDVIEAYSDHAVYMSGDRTKSKTYSSLNACLSANEMFSGEIIIKENMSTGYLDFANNCIINLNNCTLNLNSLDTTYNVHVGNGANIVVKNGHLLSMPEDGARGFSITNGTVSLANVQMDGKGRLFNVWANYNESLSAVAKLTIDKDSCVSAMTSNGEPLIFQRSAEASAYYNQETEQYEFDKAPRSTVCVSGKLIAECPATSCEYVYCICDNGNDMVGSDIVVEDGAFLSCSNGPAIHRASRAHVTLNGGEIYGTYCGIDMRTGYLTVPASSTVFVKGTGPKKLYEGGHIGGQGASQLNTGDGILIESCSYGSSTLYGLNPLPPVVDIQAGTFRSTNAEGIGSYSHSKFEYSEYTAEDLANNIRLTDGTLGVVGTKYKVTNTSGKTRTEWTWHNVIITEDDDTQWYGRVEKFVKGGDIEPVPTSQKYKRLTGENGSYNIIADGFTVAE